MATTLLILATLFNHQLPTKTISLETKGRALIDIRGQASGVYDDGSIVICTKTMLYHFDEEGHLIRYFGGRGQGPNEYESIRASIWTGNHYLISDGRNLRTTILNADGEFVANDRTYFTKFIVSEDVLFYVFGGPIDQTARAKPPFIGFLEIKNQQISVNPKRFHNLTERIVDLGYDYHKHFPAVDGNTIYVINEVDPIIYTYDRASLKPGKKYEVKLPEFIPAPALFPEHIFVNNGAIAARNKYMEWRNTWSRIIGFDMYQETMFIAYTIPAESEDLETINLAARWNPDTGSTQVKSLDANRFLGFRNGQAFSLEVDDEWVDREPTYKVRMYSWK